MIILRGRAPPFDKKTKNERERIEIHYNRQSIRLPNYDYSQNGMYYITICTKNRENILSDIKIENNWCRGRVPPLPKNEPLINLEYTAIGKIVENTINNINKNNNIKIINHIIMPDHIHFIVQINNYIISNEKQLGQGWNPAPTLNTIIGRFKSYTTKQYNILNNTIGTKLWQRNYYEHIIRNEQEYIKICEYIRNNPNRFLKHHKSNNL